MLNVIGFLVCDVGDVVGARIGVGLDPELVCPERMDHIQRGHVQLDVGVRRKLQRCGLDPTVGREAVGETPLLRDHLHLQAVPVLAAAGFEIGFGP